MEKIDPLSLSSSTSSGSSPVLFNPETRMVDCIDSMFHGCSMIMIESNQISDKTLDFQHYSLSKDNKTIVCYLNPQKSVAIADIEEIDLCNDSEINLIHEFVNVGGLEPLGLKPILFKIVFKKRKQQSRIVIFDSISNASIWYNCLKKLIGLKNPFSVKSLSLVIGNELDAYCNDGLSKEEENGLSKNDNNKEKEKEKEMKNKHNHNHSKLMKSRFDFRNAAFVENIRSNLEGISRSILEFNKFGNRNCIFGSESHIGLLTESVECMDLLKEIKHLLNINDENCQIFFSSNNYDIYHLKQIWIKLNVKLTIVCLKSLDLRNALQIDENENENEKENNNNNNNNGEKVQYGKNIKTSIVTPKETKSKKVKSIYDIFESAIEID